MTDIKIPNWIMGEFLKIKLIEIAKSENGTKKWLSRCNLVKSLIINVKIY